MAIVYPTLLHLGVSTLLALYLALSGLKKKSLSKSGALGAFIVGIITFIGGWRFGVTLVAFYLSSSKLTKWKKDIKAQLEDNFEGASQRTIIQVFANGGVGTAAVLFYFSQHGVTTHAISNLNDTSVRILIAFLASYACCCGDTWASELGILAKGEPRLITTGRQVPRGTNGGVSPLGLGASFAGGVFCGVAFTAAHYFETSEVVPAFVIIGAVAGLGGSLIDSLLGATVQSSILDTKRGVVLSEVPAGGKQGKNYQHICGANLLDNHGVNIAACVITSALFYQYGTIFLQ